MDQAELERREEEAVYRFFGSRIFPLFDVLKKAHVGTASLFRRDEHHFVVSAHHVLEAVLDAKMKRGTARDIRMPAGPTKNAERPEPVALVPLGDGEFIRTKKVARDFGDDDYREDIGVYRLRPESAERMKKAGWVFMTDEDVLFGSAGEFVMFGWPMYDITPISVDPGFQVTGVPNHFTLFPIPPPVPDPLISDFFLKYDPGFPHLEGISGSPIWARLEDAGALWHGGKGLKLFGIEHAMASDKSYVRGTMWGLISRLIRQIVEEAERVPPP